MSLASKVAIFQKEIGCEDKVLVRGGAKDGAIIADAFDHSATAQAVRGKFANAINDLGFAHTALDRLRRSENETGREFFAENAAGGDEISRLAGKLAEQIRGMRRWLTCATNRLERGGW